MTIVTRLREWWLGQFRGTSGLSKVAWVSLPVLFACCGLTLAVALVVPDQDTEPPATATTIPTRAVAEPALVATDLPVRPPATATDRPTAAPTATTRPTNTPRPTLTPRPTATDRPKITTVPATVTQTIATRPPATATLLPLPTATVVRVATIVLPTATAVPPPPPAPTATLAPANCDPSYPDVCIAPPPPDLDCGDIPYRRFRVIGSDPHRFDGDGNGIGCESD